jgi:RNA polymerase sigma-70 factor (ECF subfamily)
MSLTMDRRGTAFSKVYEQHFGAIHAYAARRVGVEAADEVAAETFLIAWRRFDQVPAVPLPWLYGVARNVVHRHHDTSHRQTLARQAAERERPAHAPDDVEDTVLWDAWSRLRPADREILALVAWEDLTVAEAARVLGCPAARFSVRLFRARRRLERLLSEPAPSIDSSEA